MWAHAETKDSLLPVTIPLLSSLLFVSLHQYFSCLSCNMMVSNLLCQRSPLCVNIRVHGIAERGSYLLHNFPCQRECRAIYSRVSQLLGVPSQLLTLSTGVKILRRGLPLQTYISDFNISNGLSLYCNITLLGGGSDDEDDEGGKGMFIRLSLRSIKHIMHPILILLMLKDRSTLSSV